MPRVLVGTDAGLFAIDGEGPGGPRPAGLDGLEVVALAAEGSSVWALVAGRVLERLAPDDVRWEEVAVVPDRKARCLLVHPSGLLVGTSEAGLLRLRDGGLESVPGFDSVEGRAGWYTPWGGPPDTRSMAAGPDGTLYANVHVGGIPRSTDGGESWEPTIDVDADVHQVLADQARDLLLASTARGVATSPDHGETWTFHGEGLHARYCRAVAVAGDTVLASASDGPRGGRAAVYRADWGQDLRFERCDQGLPGWFGSNIDTACLSAAGDVVAFGTAEGSVFASDDRGETWRSAGDTLPPVRCLLIS